MDVGFIGLGKLGLPVALAVESKGHRVYGYDVSPAVTDAINDRKLRYTEEGAAALLKKTALQLTSVADMVSKCDIIFCAVHTPHDPKYEGITPVPDEDADFDYRHLKDACAAVSSEATRQDKPVVMAVISTVLPGTIYRDIMPTLSDNVSIVYNPFFIAMGTAIQDFLHPEFVLLGVRRKEAAELVERFYKTITDAPVRRMSIPSAELTKVAYNTFISMKIGVVNTLMEICHKTPGASVNDVTDALKIATRRIVSPAYMTAGMGDGGGCHPRDNIAMSYLADKLKLSFNPFRALMKGRDAQAEWLAAITMKAAKESNLPIVIMGRSFKPETNIETGSAALLVAHYIDGDYKHYDRLLPGYPAVYLIATQHQQFAEEKFPIGSVVVDPFRYIPGSPGVRLIRIGEYL
jgi:UDPglucose 6-dehydrogenase